MTESVSCASAADAEIVRDVIWKRVSAALVGVGALSKGTGAFAVNGHSADPDGGGPTANLAEWSAATQDSVTGRYLVEMPTAWIDQEMGLSAFLKPSSANLDSGFLGGYDVAIWFETAGQDLDFVRRGEAISGHEVATHLRSKAVSRSQGRMQRERRSKDILSVVER